MELSIRPLSPPPSVSLPDAQARCVTRETGATTEWAAMDHGEDDEPRIEPAESTPTQPSGTSDRIGKSDRGGTGDHPRYIPPYQLEHRDDFLALREAAA